jgi:TonB family protein
MKRIARLLLPLLAAALVTGCMTQQTRPPQPLKLGGQVYPEQAAAQRVEGYVVVSYDVTVDGTTENARVVESFPALVFDEAALTAVRGWRFQPAIDHGRTIPFRLESTVRFKLGESQEYAR